MLGAALISPWGQFDTSAPSYQRNRYKDSIDAPVLQKWSAYFMGAADPDNYNQPFLAPAGWWAGLNEVVQDVRVTAGTDEVLVDDISAFAEIIKTVIPHVSTVIGPGEVHDQPFIEPITEDEDKSQQARQLKAWLKTKM